MRKNLALFVFSAFVLLPGILFAQRDLKNIPDPDPEIERKSFVVPEGFEVNLYAADPLLAKPIQMNFDELGRLWIASSEVYPHIKPGQAATDKVLVLEDADRNGIADKTTVFADNLLIPTGVLPGDGGAYVVNSTELIHLKDSNGDGKADKRRVVLSGFGTEDTHHLLHTLRWGHDGQLYMNQSIYIHSHLETPHGVRRLNGGGIWRFRPETQELSVFCRGLVNSWGHHFDRFGQSFATDGAGGDGINFVFPGAVFVTAVNAKRTVGGLNPGSPKHCGLEVVSGGHFPPEWQGNMVTNDFRAHRVCRFVVREDNSGFASRQEVEVIKSNHPAFRPIDVKMGPDGAMYVADWYNPIIQHGEVDFRDPRRDHTHGRIWRVSAKGRPLVELPKFAALKVSELIELRDAQEEWIRLHAGLELKRRDAAEVSTALAIYVKAITGSDEASQRKQLNALWTYQAINVVEPNLVASLAASPDHRVRAAAIRVAAQWQNRLNQPIALFEAGVADAHPRVRLESLRALAETGVPHAAEIAARALDKAPLDRFIDFALWQTMRDLSSVWLPALNEGRIDFSSNAKHLTYALQAVESRGALEPLLQLLRENRIGADRLGSSLSLIASLGGPKELGVVLDLVLDEGGERSPEFRSVVLASLLETSLERKIVPAGELNRLKKLLQANNEALRAAAIRAVGGWKVVELRESVVMLTKDSSAPAAVRESAIASLASFGDNESQKTLVELASGTSSLQDRRAAIVALAQLDVDTASRLAVALCAKTADNNDPAPLVSTILRRKGGTNALASALAGKTLAPDMAKLFLRSAQGALDATPELSAAIQKAGNLENSGWKMSADEVQAFVSEVGVKGNAVRGEAIFRRGAAQCLKCHAIGGSGGRVGPDLVSIGASAPVDYLVKSLIEPNDKVKEGFHSKVVTTADGRQIMGILIRESGTGMLLRDVEDREISLLKENIESIKDSRSLMPDGVVDSLTREELIDLTRFLSELGRQGPFAITRDRLVRTWQAVEPTPEARQGLSRASYEEAFTKDSAYNWSPIYSQVSGVLPLDEAPLHGAPSRLNRKPEDKLSVLRFEVEVSTPGEAKLLTGDSKGLVVLLDGRKLETAAEMPLDLTRGSHRFVIVVERWLRPNNSLRLELQSPDGSPIQFQIAGGK